jgi:hypothetical protein
MVKYFLIAFLATFLVSRLTLWLLGKWDGGMAKLLAAHALSLAICWAVFAFGTLDGKVYLEGGILFVLPQAVWFLVDYFRGKSAREG